MVSKDANIQYHLFNYHKSRTVYINNYKHIYTQPTPPSVYNPRGGVSLGGWGNNFNVTCVQDGCYVGAALGGVRWGGVITSMIK